MQYADDFFRDGLGAYAPCLHPVHDTAESIGVAGVKIGLFMETLQGGRGNAQHSRSDGTGPQYADPDLLQLQFHTQRIGILIEGALGDGIDSRKGERIQRCQLARGNEDTGACTKKRQKGFIHKKNAAQVDLKNPLKL